MTEILESWLELVLAVLVLLVLNPFTWVVTIALLAGWHVRAWWARIPLGQRFTPPQDEEGD